MNGQAKTPLQKLIEKTREEVVELEHLLSAKKHFLGGLEQAEKLTAKTSNPSFPSNQEQKPLRPGSDLAKCVEVLEASSVPLHIKDLLSAIGKEANKENRVGLAGSLSQYVRSGKWFVKTAPNTFGLISKNYSDPNSANFSEYIENEENDDEEVEDDNSPF